MHGLYTPGHGYRFSRVQVWVALKNPRVTYANPWAAECMLWSLGCLKGR